MFPLPRDCGSWIYLPGGNPFPRGSDAVYREGSTFPLTLEVSAAPRSTLQVIFRGQKGSQLGSFVLGLVFQMHQVGHTQHSIPGKRDQRSSLSVNNSNGKTPPQKSPRVSFTSLFSLGRSAFSVPWSSLWDEGYSEQRQLLPRVPIVRPEN